MSVVFDITSYYDDEKVTPKSNGNGYTLLDKGRYYLEATDVELINSKTGNTGIVVHFKPVVKIEKEQQKNGTNLVTPNTTEQFTLGFWMFKFPVDSHGNRITDGTFLVNEVAVKQLGELLLALSKLENAKAYREKYPPEVVPLEGFTNAAQIVEEHYSHILNLVTDLDGEPFDVRGVVHAFVTHREEKYTDKEGNEKSITKPSVYPDKQYASFQQPTKWYATQYQQYLNCLEVDSGTTDVPQDEPSGLDEDEIPF